MKYLLNKRVRQIQFSGIRKIANLVAQYPDVINLTIGQPDFSTPKHIKTVGKTAIEENRTTYTHNAGLMELREAACDYMFQKYKLLYQPVDEVIVTVGASEALDITFRTILEEGDEVILPSPIYPGYAPIIELCGAIPVYVDTSTNNFKLSAELLHKKLSDKTKCIILPYPSNPIGSTLDQKELDEISKLLLDKEIFIVSDEIYSELTYEKKHTSMASIPEMRNKTIVINGLSKSHSMTGWRIGFVFAPSYIVEEMLKIHLYNATCASSISQYAAIEALIHGKDDPISMKDEYLKRRDFIYKRLLSIGMEVSKPQGAFYIFPSIKHTNKMSAEFALELLESAGVAVVPGDVFSKAGEGYIRISYANDMKLLEEGMNRIEQYVNSINPKGEK
ncbi:aminotransferase A [Peribacillus sp. NJ11]|uniref:aminotransferase A n=1 Tax=Peribacillus sp. NJ11 TaxID=3055861 RepID=UPI0025A10A4E|nr:aminotransferase A [Peribacillus sp. NJ11]MDM5224345.1 aminotransferase A [Peribacillus sp. NJ11]